MKLLKIPSTILIALMLLGMLAIPRAIAAGTAGNVKMIDPADGNSDFIYDTNHIPPGGTFKLQIWFYPNGTQNVKGWQVLISYPTDLLDCMGEALPAGHIFDTLTFSHPAASIDEGAGTISAMAMLITPASINVSTEKICTEITFKITKIPTMLDPLLTGNFTFLKINLTGGTYFINEGGIKLDLNYFGAYYEVSWVAPSVVPWLEVRDPVDGDHTITATDVRQEKLIDIYIHDCAAGWEMIGIQFQLWYDNTSLISYVGSASDPDYTNGTFMEAFVGDGLGIFYVVRADFEGAFPVPPGAPIGQNYFAVMILKLPNASAKWNPPFPEGGGKLITLKIVSLLQGLFPDKYSCNLTIANVKFINQYGDEIGQGHHVSGIYEIEPKVLGRKIDVYTQYPDPFGGQGLNKPSDMFWPQKEVILTAKVTYNEWPEQQKDVAFQIIDPHNETWGVLCGRTDENGTVTVSFRLPWPCDVPEYWFGEWTVIASVDVACNVTTDTLKFKYDYLVHIVSVEPDKTQYKHCEYMNVTISLKSYAMQHYNITVTMTVQDETGVPFGYIYGIIDIGGAEYCTYKPYEIELSVHVVKFARAGTATIHVCALNDLPINGGYAQCPYVDEKVQILAEWA